MSVRRSAKEYRRARKLAKTAWLKQGMKCYHCGKDLAWEAYTADHFPIPRYADGPTDAGNIVASCAKCNNERNPEMNRSPRGTPDITVGDTTSRSPFEILRSLLPK